MPALDIPFFGTLILGLTLISASYTMADRHGGGPGTTRIYCPSARWGTYATVRARARCRVRARVRVSGSRFSHSLRRSLQRPFDAVVVSDRVALGRAGRLACSGGRFCSAGYTFFATRWLRGRYTELQPWILATLMSILIFFWCFMLFAANPFATYIRTTPGDGEGLNPLLQNYWMAIHPPSLYMGFVGWSVPFAILIAALVTGRLGNEWVRAARLWSMIAWTFLSLGLLLGCLWSYEELGWGGYWAWDPVENASFMPWLVGTAYLHSVLIQERRHMMKVWNVFLLALTFFLTIFGTFLTRSGLIASVHSFARSDIGQYFVWYMAFLIIVDRGADDLAPSEAQGRQRNRVAGQPRVRVPAEQLGAARDDGLRAGRDDVPSAQPVGARRGSHRRARLLQQVDGAARHRAAVPRRARTPGRMAQSDGLEARARAGGSGRASVLPSQRVPAALRCVPRVSADRRSNRNLRHQHRQGARVDVGRRPVVSFATCAIRAGERRAKSFGAACASA